jgi:hypothetical protein
MSEPEVGEGIRLQRKDLMPETFSLKPPAKWLNLFENDPIWFFVR